MSRRAAAHGEGACAPARPYMGPQLEAADAPSERQVRL